MPVFGAMMPDWMIGKTHASLLFLSDAEQMLELPHVSHERRTVLLQAILDIKSGKLVLEERTLPGEYCEKLGIA